MPRFSMLPASVTVLAAVVFGVAAPGAFAEEFTWIQGGGSYNFSEGANWAGGVAPSGTVGTLSFPPASRTYSPTNDIAGLAASTLSITTVPGAANPGGIGSPGPGGAASKPLTLSSGLTLDNQAGGGSQIALPLVLSAPNTWTVVHGFGSVTGGVSGNAPLDVKLPDAGAAQPLTGFGFEGAANEVGPVTITGTGRGSAFAVVGNYSGAPGDLNGTNGNLVVVKDLQLLTAIGRLGALTMSNAELSVGVGLSQGAQFTNRELHVASATFGPGSRIRFQINAAGSRPGVDVAEITSSGAIDLGGATAVPDFNDQCPPLGATYTLISTTGTISGENANPFGTFSCQSTTRLSYRIDVNRGGSPQTLTATIVPYDQYALAGVRPVSPPTVTGDAVVGATLTGTHGTWSPAATNPRDIWIRCESLKDLSTCQGIAGATTLRYRITARDVGNRILLREFPGQAGAMPQDSVPTAVVQAAAATPAQVQTALKQVGTPPASASVRSVLAAGVKLTFTAPSAGRPSVAWSAKTKTGSVVVAQGSRLVPKRGKTTLTVRPTTAGKRLLKAAKAAKRPLALTSRASFAPNAGKSITRTMRFRLKR